MALQAQRAYKEQLGLKAFRVLQEVMVQTELLVRQEVKAQLARMQYLLELQAPRVSRVRLVRQVQSLARLGPQVLKAPQGHKDLRGQRAVMALREYKERLVLKEQLELLGQQVPLV